MSTTLPRVPRVLWIEDSARLELRNLVGPIYVSGEYDFSLAEDVSNALEMLRSEEFDVVIVDIRLPPGQDPHWRELYRRTGADKVQAQLGLKLLRWLLTADRKIYPESPPRWISARRLAVFTVESRQEIGGDLDELGIDIFQQKVASLPDTILIELIARLLERNGHAGG